MRAGVDDPVGGRAQSAHRLAAASDFTATPPSVARGNHIKDVGKQFVLAPADVTTISEWSPRGRTTPTTVTTVTSLLSSVAKEGHQEDDNYPALARCRETMLAASSRTNKRTALVFKTSLELKDEEGRASGIKPQLEFLAFWAGIG